MKILAIGSHIDDIELGCGGTLHKLAQNGHEVFYLALSNCDNPELFKEVQVSTSILGIKLLELFTFKHRNFDKQRQEILDTMIKYRDKLLPEIIFTHGSNDLHQDHQVTHAESLRAFKELTIFGYNFPWNQFHESKTLCTIKIDLEKKIEALNQFRSQAHRGYFKTDFIRAWNFEGEKFEVIKLNGKILCAE